MQTFDRLLHQIPEKGQERVRKFRHEGDAIREWISVATSELMSYLAIRHITLLSQGPQ